MVPSQNEIARQFRVLRQTIGIHGILRDTLHRRAVSLKVALLFCSAIFCATTFAGDEFYGVLGVTPAVGRLARGIASAIAFAASLTLLLVDLDGRSRQHATAVEQLTSVLAAFRSHRLDDGTWPEAQREYLSQHYWEGHKAILPIPDAQFNALKARYLHKVELSTLESVHPSCPRSVLRIYARVLGIRALSRGGAASAPLDGSNDA